MRIKRQTVEGVFYRMYPSVSEAQGAVVMDMGYYGLYRRSNTALQQAYPAP